MPGLYLPETAREQIEYENAGIQRPRDGGPDCLVAAELERRLQDVCADLILGLDTRGMHEGRWCAYYRRPGYPPEKCFAIEHEDGSYKYPDPAIVATVRDTQADPAHYEKVMRDEFAAKEKRRHDAATEWGAKATEAAEWVGKRFSDERENYAHRKGINLHKDD